MPTRKDISLLLDRVKNERCAPHHQRHQEWLNGAKVKRDAHLNELAKKASAAVEKLGLTPHKFTVEVRVKGDGDPYRQAIHIDPTKDKTLALLAKQEKESVEARDQAIKPIVQQCERMKREVMLSNFTGGRIPDALKKRLDAFIQHDGEIEDE